MAEVTGFLFRKKDGYGFLKRDDGGEDCFLLPTALIDAQFDALAENTRLAFEPYLHERTNRLTGEVERKWRARNVRLLES